MSGLGGTCEPNRGGHDTGVTWRGMIVLGVMVANFVRAGDGGRLGEVDEAVMVKAESGDALAQAGLGFACCLGLGAARDDEAAVRWWRRAAEQGNVLGQTMLGWAYLEGRGVGLDHAHAYEWFSRASQASVSPAPGRGRTFPMEQEAPFFRDMVAGLMSSEPEGASPQ